MTVTVHKVHGLIGPLRRDNYAAEWRPGLTAADLVATYRGDWGDPLAAIYNGRVLRGSELDLELPDGADLVVLPDPAGVIEWVALYVLLPALISVGINYAYQALVGTPQVAQERGEGEESPAYSWDGIRTGYGAGYRIPVVYGSHRVGGQVVAGTVYELGQFQDVLGLLMVVSEGRISSIAGIDLETFTERNNLGGLFNPSPNPGLVPQGLEVNGNAITDTSDYNMSLRAGTLFQAPVPRWPDVTTVYSVGFELLANQLQVYTCIATEVTSARIRIQFAALFKQSGNAASPHSVTFGYQFRRNFGNWSGEQQVTATAARRTRFFWSFLIEFPEPGQWEIRIRRITPDDGSDTLSSSTWAQIVEQYGAGQGQQLRYPNLALMALELRATERVQGQAPTVTVPIHGRMVDWWTTGGGWQGETFFDVSTSRWIGRNPAWIAADFLTDPIYGLGRWVTKDDLVLAQFEDWGDWNDELVSDGGAGTHPRNHCDLVVDRGAPAWEILLQIFRTGQAAPVLNGRQIGVKYEHPDSGSHPRPRVQVFTQANMASFEMTWNDTRSRPNIVDAQILDEDRNWEQTMISVEDPDAFGLNQPWVLNAETIRRQTVEFFGVTRAAHARRLVWFMLATNRLWAAAVRFVVGIDALAAEVGDVVGVETDVVRFFDVATQGLRTTAAVVASAVVRLDQTVTITGSGNQSLAIWQDDGTAIVATIISGAATYAPGDPLILSSGPINCNKGAVCAFGDTSKTIRDVVITGINLSEELTREVEAVLYDESAFTIPSSLSLPDSIDPDISQPFLIPLEGASNITLDLFEHGTRAVVGWERPVDQRGTVARVYLRHDRVRGAIMLEDRLADEWLPVWQGLGDEAELLGLEPGQTYDLAVVLERRDGNAPAPGDVTSFTFQAREFPNVSPLAAVFRWAAQRSEGFELAWNDARHDSTRRYEVRQGTIWDGAYVVARTAAERIWLKDAPYGDNQVYQVRTVAESGLHSEPEYPISVNVAVPACLSLQASYEW